MGDQLPPISGFVMTSVKDSSLVEVILRSPEPTNPESSTLLATWNYGLGKTVAFTTDAGARWANDWTGWEQYDRFFSQMVRWSMRPTGDTGNFTVATDVKEGRARVVIDALDKDEEFLDLPTIGGAAVRPDLGSTPLDFQQVAPGRYVAEFDAEDPGSYMIMVNPGAGQGAIRTGVSVGYSDEFRDRETNRALLESMAELPADRGEPGRLFDAEGVELTDQRSAETNDPYRRDLPPVVASQPIWPLLVLTGSCVFVADVFVRRVQVGFGWVGVVWGWLATKLLRRPATAPEPQTMSRLRSRKAQVQESFASKQDGGTRFEAPEDSPAEADSPLADLRNPGDKPATTKPPNGKPLAEEAPEAKEGYTSRLLKAKRDAQRKRDE